MDARANTLPTQPDFVFLILILLHFSVYICQFCPSTLWPWGSNSGHQVWGQLSKPARPFAFLELLIFLPPSPLLCWSHCADQACCPHPILQVTTLILSPWSETEFRPQATVVLHGFHRGCAVAKGHITMSQLSQVPAPHPTTSALSQSRAESQSQRASSALCLLPSSCSHSPLPLPLPVPPVPWLE